jgi:hypothetical protein
VLIAITVADASWERSQKSWEAHAMTITAADALRELAAPWNPGDRIKAAIDRAARRAGLTYWRAFDIWYGKARRIEEFERDAIADALAKKREQEASRELHELKTRLARLESVLVLQDPAFHRPQIDALGVSVRGPRRGDSALD